MADEENEIETSEPTPVVAPAEGGVLDLNSALQLALKKALVHNGVARGLRECVKNLDRRQAHLCILASDCDSPEYVRLVEALAQEHSISLIKVGVEVNICSFMYMANFQLPSSGSGGQAARRMGWPCQA
jgi:small subunit ribosomal protein S12e